MSIVLPTKSTQQYLALTCSLCFGTVFLFYDAMIFNSNMRAYSKSANTSDTRWDMHILCILANVFIYKNAHVYFNFFIYRDTQNS